MGDLRRASLTAVRDCLGVKKAEKVLVVVDEKTRDLGRFFYEAARELGAEAMIMEFKSRSNNGEEPPEPVAEAMKSADVVIAPTSKSLSHTKARRRACEAGARVATLPGITEDIMQRTLVADYSAIREKSDKAAAILTGGSLVEITTPLGTNLKMSIQGRTSKSDHGIIHSPGDFSNLPAGEAYIAPLEGTTEGTLVIDGALAGVGVLDSPITLKIRGGMVEEIEGGASAEGLRKLLDSVGRDARNIAELGIGTNGAARIGGVVLEDEKVLGTVHVALGNNSSFGGNVEVPLHIDGIITCPTVYVDGKLILQDGELLV